MAEMIQGELAKVGIKLNIKGTDVMVGLHQLMNDETDINFGGQTAHQLIHIILSMNQQLQTQVEFMKQNSD